MGWLKLQPSHHEFVLTAEQVARLEALVGWVWDILGCQWEDGFFSLENFIELLSGVHVCLESVYVFLSTPY